MRPEAAGNPSAAVLWPPLAAWCGLLLAIAGPISYVLLLGHPVLARTGLPMWIALTAAGVLSAAALLRSQSWLVAAPVVLTAVLGALLAGGFFVGLRLPAPAGDALASRAAADPDSAAASMPAIAPDFVLADQDGGRVALSDMRRGAGAVLVFYRGHW